MEELSLEEHFDGAFASCELGHTKSEKEFYDIALEKAGDVQPEEVVFWDSDEKIVETVNDLGINGKMFFSSSDIKV